MGLEFPVDTTAAASFFSSSDRSDLSPRRRVSWEVSDVLREIIDRLVDTRAGTDDLRAVTTELESVADRLRQFEHGRRYDSYSEAANASINSPETHDDDDGAPPSGHVDFSPLLGRANPLAPPMEFHLEPDPGDGSGPKVCADVTFGHAYEGPPGHVHGGLVAAALDELLGATQALSGSPGMTAQLDISYRAPTPLHVPLRLESTLDRVDGRKIYTSGRVFNGDTLCAEATGLFLSIDFSKIAAMRVDRDGASSGPTGTEPVSGSD